MSGGKGKAIRADVAVVGLGSAGEHVANQLAQAGRKVVGFEPQLVGGECPFLACMPSKALLHDAHRRDLGRGPTWQEAVVRRDHVADHREDSDHADQLVESGVELIREAARIAGPGIVETDTRRWQVDQVIVATGSAPTIPPIDGLARDQVWTFADALRSTVLPPRLLIIGAGAVGCELADVYNSFGAEVTILEGQDRLLPEFDDEVAQQYLELLRSNGLDIRLSTRAAKLEHVPHSHSTVVHTDDGSALEVDQVLVAAGKHPRLNGLGFETLGLEPDSVPELDDIFAVVGHPWLYLIGDVNQRAPWTHGANREAGVVADQILQRQATPASADHDRMAHCVFTDPAAAHVGRSVTDHEATGRRALRGSGRYSDIARASTDELDDGLAAITVDAESGVIVGGSIVGSAADELISIVAAWVHLEATLDQASRQVFPFPTIAQVLEVALDSVALDSVVLTAVGD